MSESQEVRKKSHWGWGWEDRFPSADERRERGKQAQLLLGFGPERVDEPVPLASKRHDVVRGQLTMPPELDA